MKRLRAARGWTRQPLADAVGVSRQSINSIERDRYVPSLEPALTFGRVFAVAATMAAVKQGPMLWHRFTA